MGVKVLLDSVDKVRDFIDITRSAPYDIDLISGRSTYLDAKSLLGVLSCDCRKPLLLDIHAGVEERAELLLKLEKFCRCVTDAPAIQKLACNSFGRSGIGMNKLPILPSAFL